jgi:nitroreductase
VTRSDASDTTEPEARFLPIRFTRREPAEMLRRARDFRREVETRRSVRFFSDEPIPDGLLDECILAAGSAPSGAHRQPWTFVVVTDPALKREIRIAAEAEERETYEHRMTDEWRAALHPLGTDWHKPFLETAPALIAVFRHAWGAGEEGERRTNYYTQESVGIASGFLLAALHLAGLGTLTHTPSPMGFLGQILERPENERAYLLIPVGYPSADCVVPDLERKPLDEIRVRR